MSARTPSSVRWVRFTMLIGLAMLVLPAGGALAWGVLTSFADGAIDPPSVRVLLRTLGVSLGIGMLAAACAWAPARVISARRGRTLRGLVLVPLLMPPYLVYSGYSIVRDPSWFIGDFLEHLAAQGMSWVTIGLGRVLAIWGLALWAFPIAALLLAGSMPGADVDDALRLDAPAWRRTCERVRMNRAGVFASVAAVGLVMLGSAVPLHLAQIETLAIDLWRRLSETSPEQWGSVWLAGWPIYLPAVVGAAWAPSLVRRLAQNTDGLACAPVVSTREQAIAWIVWACAVIIPLILFVSSVRNIGSLVEFWRLSGPGVVAAVQNGLATAVLTAAVALALTIVMSASPVAAVRTSSVVLAVMVFAAIMPGVFIGAALARTGASMPSFMSDLLAVDAYVLRFGCVPLIAGAAAVLAEPADVRALRTLEGCDGVRGWAEACLPRLGPVVLVAAAAAGLMAFHEIEASVMLVPPGRENLARQILGYLHFSRMEEMAAASVYLLGGGVLAGVVISRIIISQFKGS